VHITLGKVVLIALERSHPSLASEAYSTREITSIL